MNVFDAYIEARAIRKAEKHALQAAKAGKEAIGLLVGEAFEWQGKPYVVIKDYITAENSATSTTVRFDSKAFAKLAKQLNEKHSNKTIVSWSHSHPSYGCFMSSLDEATQRNYFNEEWNIAFVIDPLRREKKAFKLENNVIKEASFAVIEKR